MRNYASLLGITGLFWLTSCQAELSSSENGGSSDGVLDGGGAESLAPGVFSPPALSVPRLTRTQYVRTLGQIFGDEIPLPEELERDIEASGYTNAGAYVATYSRAAVEQLESNARAVAGHVLAAGGVLRTQLSCSTLAEATEACASELIIKIGRLLFRRTLGPEEVERYLVVFREVQSSGAGTWEALEYVLVGLLESPKFLFRIELGAPVAGSPHLRRYTSQDMASRIAFSTRGHGPDEELIALGESGAFDDPVEVERVARDRLASDTNRVVLHEFFEEYLELDRARLLSKNTEVYPLFSEDLRELYQEEVRSLIDQVALGPAADARELFSTHRGFLNERLATVYGIPGVVGPDLREVVTPEERRGFLGTGAFLATKAHVTMSSPTLRGKFVRERLLCEKIPAPPANVPPLPETTDTPMTTRERLRIHREQPACAACHALMDPIGVAFENFDTIGSYRSTEHGLTVDAQGELDGKLVNGAASLADALASDPRLGACIARQLTRAVVGREESKNEEAAMMSIAEQFSKGGHNVATLIPLILSSKMGTFAGEFAE